MINADKYILKYLSSSCADHLEIQDVVAACEIVNCNGVEVQCQVPIYFP